MTTWLLALLLLAALGALGFRQGVVRVLLSFFGIVIGALLAAPLGHLIKPLLSMAGLKHPVWQMFLPACVAFLIILTIFKIAGHVLHKKVEFHYKYNVGELEQAMWERVNHRLGLCMGLFNGAAYLVLVAVAVFPLSYWTVQMATPDSDPRGVRLLNQMGRDMQATGMNRVAVSVHRMPSTYFQAGDIVGLIYHNPLLQARLSRYPAILGLAELPQFQDLANDKDFAELQMRQAPILQIINYPKVQAIIQNPDLVKTITNSLLPNLSDLQNYLMTGKSDVFTDDILGRWDFDVNETMGLVRTAHPKMTSSEAKKYRQAYSNNFGKTSFVAAPKGVAVLKNFPHLNTSTSPATIELQNSQGQWGHAAGGTYQVNVTVDGKEEQLTGQIHGDRLSLTNQEVTLGFILED
ncbi:MAG TPA: CvpA family protein [Candidatus Angelobacter sp.]|nr:CvpA family protein [Candidatus Angelobacter sp.]